MKVETEHVLDKSVTELILLDVHRTFPNMKSFKSERLISLLNTYAYINQKVQYCQGMNFLTGFLLLQFGDEMVALRFLKCLVERYNMHELFTQDVPLLKQFFYKLDRLVHLHYPELSSAFRVEGISMSFFASAWFLTIFAYSLQYSKEERPSEVIIALWDAFLVDGWKAVFKSALFILSELRSKLLDCKFDQIMAIFGELPRGSFFHDPANALRFREHYHRIKVTNRTLVALEHEHTSSYQATFSSSSDSSGSPSPPKSAVLPPENSPSYRYSCCCLMSFDAF